MVICAFKISITDQPLWRSLWPCPLAYRNGKHLATASSLGSLCWTSGSHLVFLLLSPSMLRKMDGLPVTASMKDLYEPLQLWKQVICFIPQFSNTSKNYPMGRVTVPPLSKYKDGIWSLKRFHLISSPLLLSKPLLKSSSKASSPLHLAPLRFAGTLHGASVLQHMQHSARPWALFWLVLRGVELQAVCRLMPQGQFGIQFFVMN